MRALRLAALAATSALAVAACGGDSAGRRTVARCAAPADSAMRTAVAQYLKSVAPTPRRFLIPVGGGPDSLPQPFRQALQDAGPTYFYPTANEAQQKVVEDKLAAGGSWPTLLVAFRGKDAPSDSTVVYRLAGRWIGGELDEQPTPTRSIRLACREGNWTFDRAEEERSS